MSFKIRKAKKSKGSSSSRSSRKVRPSKIRPIDEGFVEYFTISENVYPQDRVEYGVVADIYPLSIEFVLEFCNHLKHFQYEDALKQIDKIKKEFEAEDTDFADYWTQIIDWGFIQVALIEAKYYAMSTLSAKFYKRQNVLDISYSIIVFELQKIRTTIAEDPYDNITLLEIVDEFINFASTRIKLISFYETIMKGDIYKIYLCQKKLQEIKAGLSKRPLTGIEDCVETELALLIECYAVIEKISSARLIDVIIGISELREHIIKWLNDFHEISKFSFAKLIRWVTFRKKTLKKFPYFIWLIYFYQGILARMSVFEYTALKPIPTSRIVQQNSFLNKRLHIASNFTEQLEKIHEHFSFAIVRIRKNEPILCNSFVANRRRLPFLDERPDYLPKFSTTYEATHPLLMFILSSERVRLEKKAGLMKFHEITAKTVDEMERKGKQTLIRHLPEKTVINTNGTFTRYDDTFIVCYHIERRIYLHLQLIQFNNANIDGVLNAMDDFHERIRFLDVANSLIEHGK